MWRYVEKLGRATVNGLEELGYALSLFVESFYWTFLGYRRGQAVSIRAIFKQMLQVGVAAIPISAALSFAIGIMLAVQGIHTLKAFGAESQIVVGIALSVTREFAPLIIGILIAGRSGSAIAARVGTMQVSQEIDALQVIGINPVRYLVAPALLALMIMVPVLTFFADIVGIFGGAVFSVLELNISMEAYIDRTIKALTVDDILQGIWKSIVFAIIIAVVGFINGFSVTGGAEGVGKATTRSVVQSISLIIVADMAFTFYLNR